MERMRNQEKVRENVKKWRKENKEKYNEYVRNYWKEKRRKLKELEEENKKLKSDLANIQCEFGFACEEIDYWKREDKELRKWIKEHVDYQTQADFRKRFEHK